MNQIKTLEKLNTPKESSWGGNREGSGRKPRLQYEVRELFNSAIDNEWEDIVNVIHSYVKNGDKEVVK